MNGQNSLQRGGAARAAQMEPVRRRKPGTHQWAEVLAVRRAPPEDYSRAAQNKSTPALPGAE